LTISGASQTVTLWTYSSGSGSATQSITCAAWCVTGTIS
jgi:hypothetical protein